MSLFIARSTLDVSPHRPIAPSPWLYMDPTVQERPEKLFCYIKLSDPHRDDNGANTGLSRAVDLATIFHIYFSVFPRYK